jgi:ABC-type antimicrobial peptide transport system permease subunit
MGIRMAVGATGRQVIRLVVGEMLSVVVAGLATGIGLAALVTPALASLLLGIGPRDPMTFGLIAAGLASVAALAAWIPARRAAQQDLPSILRAE